VTRLPCRENRNQRAVVTLRAFPDAPLEGTVEAVAPLAGLTTNTDTRFAVHVRLAASGLSLLPGLSGRVEIHTAEP